MSIRKIWLGLALVVSSWPSHSTAAPAGSETWVPNLTEIRDLEQSLTHGPDRPIVSRPRSMTLTPADLQTSARYYYGEFVDGAKVIKGEIIKAEGGKAGIFIQNEMPLIMDGGCSVINLSYEIRRHRFTKLECNGVG